MFKLHATPTARRRPASRARSAAYATTRISGPLRSTRAARFDLRAGFFAFRGAFFRFGGIKQNPPRHFQPRILLCEVRVLRYEARVSTDGHGYRSLGFLYQCSSVFPDRSGWFHILPPPFHFHAQARKRHLPYLAYPLSRETYPPADLGV